VKRTYRTPKGTELPIIDLRGKEYLEVKYRLVWFREQNPTWSLETDFVQVTEDSAFARAIVKDDQGRVISISHKFETREGFPDFIEKAETGAIGRALGITGFGTQFLADELDEGERIVDSPREPNRLAAAPREPEIRRRTADAPECCGEPMMLSRFQKGTWYCKKCKGSRAKEMKG
jgi:hypothetical protein